VSLRFVIVVFVVDGGLYLSAAIFSQMMTWPDPILE